MPKDVGHSLEAQRLSNLGAALLGEGELAVAVTYLRKACAIEQDDKYLCNLAVALILTGDVAEASHILAGLCERNPTNVAALAAWGQASQTIGRTDDAVRLLRKAYELSGNLEIHFDLTMALLSAGRWEEGWEHYEVRLKDRPERLFKQLSEWDGQPGKVVYAWAEQGVGDTVQFARYLPMLAEVCKGVVFGLPPALWGIFGAYGQVCKIVPLGPEPKECEYQIPLMSLAKYFRTRTDTIPQDPGWLGQTVPKTQMLSESSRPKVGVIWTSNSPFAKAKERGCTFKDVLPLLSEPCDFYSLQVGKLSSDIALSRAGGLITDLCPHIEGDWSRTVQILRELDLLICTDCGVAHIAAALGRPVWLLLHCPPDWRWTSGSWYPSVRLFRQKVPGQWGPVVAEARAALRKELMK